MQFYSKFWSHQVKEANKTEFVRQQAAKTSFKCIFWPQALTLAVIRMKNLFDMYNTVKWQWNNLTWKDKETLKIKSSQTYYTVILNVPEQWGSLEGQVLCFITFLQF